jgi:hypothetical protein
VGPFRIAFRHAFGVGPVRGARLGATAVPLSWTAAELAKGGSGTVSGVIGFNDTASNQDACKGATVTINDGDDQLRRRLRQAPGPGRADGPRPAPLFVHRRGFGDADGDGVRGRGLVGDRRRRDVPG